MKKLTSIIVTLAMLFSITATAFAADMPTKEYPQNFWDVPKAYWAFPYIAELVDRGVISGHDDGSFRPEDTVTRGEWAKIMVLAAGLKPDDNDVYFADMSGHWSNIYVNSAKDYLAAYKDGSFKPDQAAVREDVTVSMVKLKGYDVSRVDYSCLNSFKDTESISNSLKQYVAVAVEKGLITGFDDKTFRGQATLTRAEAATLLWRAFQYGSDNKVTDVDVTSQATSAPSQSKPSTTSNPTATPAQTSSTPKPTAAATQTPAAEPTPTPKSYKIDTLKSVELTRDFSYDGSSIYYISGKKVYKMDPQTGSASCIYDASSLKRQETEMQEKEVTKTITKTVPIEDDEDVSGGEDDENTEEKPVKTKEVTEEVTETVQEEVVVKEYTNYVPVQVVYDKYNSRLIMNGYYKNIEEAFKQTQTDANYYVAYDITNNGLYKEFGKPYNSSYIINIKCFVSKDKAIINNYKYDYYWNSRSHLYNMNSMTQISEMDDYARYYVYGNDIYAYGKGTVGKFDFADSKIVTLYNMPISYNKVGVKGDDLYYWDFDEENSPHKVNLTTGKVTDLKINANSSDCEIKDMSVLKNDNIWFDLVPVSDDCIVFYDKAAKAFRMISKNK